MSRSTVTRDRHTLPRCVCALALLLALAATPSGATEVSVFQMGGAVDVDKAPDGASVTTMGGNIHVHRVSRFAQLKTYGGSIVIDSAAGPVIATTMGGNIEIGSATASVTATTMAGNVEVHVSGEHQGDKRTISLVSYTGAISLFLPPGFGATVQVELARTNNQARQFQIINNVGLKAVPRDGGFLDFMHGTPRTYLDARGVVGDGASRIVIRTVNGDVTVHQAGR